MTAAKYFDPSVFCLVMFSAYEKEGAGSCADPDIAGDERQDDLDYERNGGVF